MNPESNQPTLDWSEDLPASLFVGGQKIATGYAVLHKDQLKGKFWPKPAVRLGSPYPEANLKLLETSRELGVKNVHQCPASPWHWNFDVL